MIIVCGKEEMESTSLFLKSGCTRIGRESGWFTGIKIDC